jgi:hypothetical protein
MARLRISGLSDLDATKDSPSQRAPIAAWAFYALTAFASLWLFLFLSGLMPWLGTAEGSSRHGKAGARLRDDSSLGLSAMFLIKGQKAVWDYDVAVEGDDGLILRVSKTPPQPDFIVKTLRIEQSAKGRFEVIAPATGLYTFDYELVPIGALFGPAKSGSTRYMLRWGVE